MEVPLPIRKGTLAIDLSLCAFERYHRWEKKKVARQKLFRAAAEFAQPASFYTLRLTNYVHLVIVFRRTARDRRDGARVGFNKTPHHPYMVVITCGSSSSSLVGTHLEIDL